LFNYLNIIVIWINVVVCDVYNYQILVYITAICVFYMLYHTYMLKCCKRDLQAENASREPDPAKEDDVTTYSNNMLLYLLKYRVGFRPT
jgi:hypothetical protein